jgi:hypothetical protein
VIRLPPSWERNRSQPLSRAGVWTKRVAFAATPIYVMLFAAIGASEVAIGLVIVMVLAWNLSPAHWRRQILGRA